jgi:hypothetical protein
VDWIWLDAKKNVGCSSYACVDNVLVTSGISSMDKLCDNCEGGNSSGGVEKGAEPLTSFAEAHIANTTVKSFFSTHITGRCNKENLQLRTGNFI